MGNQLDRILGNFTTEISSGIRPTLGRRKTKIMKGLLFQFGRKYDFKDVGSTDPYDHKLRKSGFWTFFYTTNIVGIFTIVIWRPTSMQGRRESSD